ncbi:hypothetical protein KUTeg_022825, partial [Tegillarca granosa]
HWDVFTSPPTTASYWSLPPPITTQATIFKPPPVTVPTTPRPVIKTLKCPRAVDVVVAYAGSDRLGTNGFQKLKQSILDFIDRLNIGYRRIWFGAVMFTHTMTTIGPDWRKAMLKKDIEGLQNFRNGGNTHLAVEATRFMLHNFGRWNVTKIGIILTDDSAKNYKETVRQALLARTEDLNMFAIGVSNSVKMNELHYIASQNNFIMRIPTIQSLSLLPLADVICKYPCAQNRGNKMKIHDYKYSGNCRAYWQCNGHSHPKCCEKGHAYKEGVGCISDPSCKMECPPMKIGRHVGCDKRPVFQNKAAFEQRIPGFGWVKMPCAGGTTYNPTDCECTQHADYLHDKSEFLFFCKIDRLK